MTIDTGRHKKRCLLFLSTFVTIKCKAKVIYYAHYMVQLVPKIIARGLIPSCLDSITKLFNAHSNNEALRAKLAIHVTLASASKSVRVAN